MNIDIKEKYDKLEKKYDQLEKNYKFLAKMYTELYAETAVLNSKLKNTLDENIKLTFKLMKGNKND